MVFVVVIIGASFIFLLSSLYQTNRQATDSMRCRRRRRRRRRPITFQLLRRAKRFNLNPNPHITSVCLRVCCGGGKRGISDFNFEFFFFFFIHFGPDCDDTKSLVNNKKKWRNRNLNLEGGWEGGEWCNERKGKKKQTNKQHKNGTGRSGGVGGNRVGKKISDDDKWGKRWRKKESKKLQSKILAQQLKLYKKKREEWDQNLGSREKEFILFRIGGM